MAMRTTAKSSEEREEVDANEARGQQIESRRRTKSTAALLEGRRLQTTFPLDRLGRLTKEKTSFAAVLV